MEECNEDESIAEDDDVDVGGKEETDKITRTSSSKFANFSGQLKENQVLGKQINAVKFN